MRPAKKLCNDNKSVCTRPNTVEASLIKQLKGVVFSFSVPEKRFLYMSSTAKESLGYPAMKFLKNPDLLKKIILKEHRQYFKERWADLLKGKPVGVLEYKIMSSGGEIECIRQSNSIIHDSKRNISEIRGIICNCTSEKHAEESLKKSRQSYKTILENTNDIIFSCGSDGIITFISPNVSNLGYTEKDIMGRNFAEFIHPDDQKQVVDDFQQTLKTSRTITSCFRIRKKNSGFLHVEEKDKVIKENGEITRIVGIMRDITERIKAEAKVKEQMDMLIRFKDATVDLALHMKSIEHENKELRKEIEKLKLKARK